MRFFNVFPLMIVPVVIYNVLALGGATLSTIEAMRLRLDTDVYAITMTSGATWHVTPGHAPVSYTHLRAHETKANLVCRLLLEKKK